MKRIFKYEIPVIRDHFFIDLPQDAEILTFQSQNEKFYIWAIVDCAENETVVLRERYFRLIGTGHDLTEDFRRIRKYVGTAQIMGGGLVFHLFEIYGRGRGQVALSGRRKGEDSDEN